MLHAHIPIKYPHETSDTDNSIAETITIEEVIQQPHCSQCNVSFDSEYDLNEHMKLSHIINCKECDATFENVTFLSNHMTHKHTSSSTSEVCEVTFFTDSHLETPENITHEQNTCICNDCKHVIKNIELKLQCKQCSLS